MSFSKAVGSASNQWVVGVGILLSVGACTAKTNDTMGAATGGSGSAAPSTSNSSMPAGGAGTAAATGGKGSTTATGASGATAGGKAGSGTEFTGNAGAKGGTAGTSTGAAGTTTGTAGTAGTSTAGTGAPPTGGVCDTSAFVQNCTQGGAQWGTNQQTGPCASGQSTYGVKTQYGPYGVKSKIDVGSGAGGTDDSAFCNGIFIPSFGADPVGSADLMNTHDLDFDKYSVFYPGCMPAGEKYPLITWGNGTCAMPEGYGPLLRYVASFGYIIVAANNREVAGGAPMTHGIDVMLAENDKMDSEFYQRIDKDKIGAMGHSQGAAATVSAAADPRIKAIIAWNSGTSTDKPFLNVSGDNDLGAGTDPSSLRNSTMATPMPGAWLWYHQVPQAVNGSTTGSTAPGHLTLMMESERVYQVALAWFDMELKSKADAKNMFIGATCTLCDGSAFPSMWPPFTGLATPSLEYGHNDMLQ